jgi:hypothetical protein
LKKEEVKLGLRKAYKEQFVEGRKRVSLSEETLKAITHLSRVMIHLWNMAQMECEHRLDVRTQVTTALKVWRKKKTDVAEEYSFNDVFGNPFTTMLDGDTMERLKGVLSISAIGLNYWLIAVRSTATITLESGEIIALKRVNNDLCREVLKKLAGSYSSFFKLKKKKDKRARKPGQKQEDWFQTMSWSTATFNENSILVSGIDRARIEIPLDEYLQEKVKGKKIVHATLSKNRDGIFELSIVAASELPALIENPKLFRAIDLGAGDIAVSDSDGSQYLIPVRRPDKFWMPNIMSVEKRQEACTETSRLSKRLANFRKYMHERSGEQKKSFQRKLARALFEDKSVECIVIGKGQTRLGLAQSKDGTAKQHYGAQNTGYLFRQFLFLKEKAEERGISVIESPDPKRKGNLRPKNKFFASRELLRHALRARGLPMPKEFTLKEFYFDQGQGVSHPNHPKYKKRIA